MTCDLCSKKEATVHLTEVINDETRELHLCQACAQEKGITPEKDFGLTGLLAGLTDFGSKSAKSTAASKQPPCPKCGMTYEDFRKSGRLGCAACYDTFRRYLAPLLRRIHGSTQHLGKQPVPAAKRGKASAPHETLAQLKERLKAAVAKESYEEAAFLRDKIRAFRPKKKSR